MDDEEIPDRERPPVLTEALISLGTPRKKAKVVRTTGDVVKVPFYGTVPDHVMADPSLLLPANATTAIKRGGKPIFGGIRWLIHSAVIAQGRATVIIPDVLFNQAVWGGDPSSWPKNRRQQVLSMLRKSIPSSLMSVEHMERSASSTDEGLGNEDDQVRAGAEPCQPGCPLYNRNIPHHHFRITIRTVEKEVNWVQEYAAVEAGNSSDTINDTFLGTLEVFGDGEGEGRTYKWGAPLPPPKLAKPKQTAKQSSDEDDVDEDFDDGNDANEQMRQGLIRKFREAGMTFSVYLPILIFGTSPKLKHPPRQRLILRALTMELTRLPKKAKSERPDKAQVIPGGSSTVGAGDGVSVFPDLPKGTGYVGFNGNGGEKHHGRGYSLRSWMDRAGFPVTDADESFWKVARAFLQHLIAVAEMFGLTVAAWHPKRKAWQPLSELSKLTRSDTGRSWLSAAKLRIYTPADYPERWRTLFADRMGFSTIPRPGEELAEVTGPEGSPESLRAYLVKVKMTEAEFAAAIGVTKSALSKRMNGMLRWDPEWMERLKSCIREQEERPELPNAPDE
jgi:hypothetical protein